MTVKGPEEIEKLIRQSIPAADISLSDLRGDGTHYAVSIVSPAFSGKTRVEQHRMVHAALDGHIDYDTQGLAIQTSTPQ